MDESTMLSDVYLHGCLVYVKYNVLSDVYLHGCLVSTWMSCVKYNVSHDLGCRIRVTKVAIFCNITPALQSVFKHTNPVQTSTS